MDGCVWVGVGVFVSMCVGVDVGVFVRVCVGVCVWGEVCNTSMHITEK